MIPNLKIISPPSRTTLFLAFYGLLSYLFFLLASIPAQQVWQLIPQKNKAQLQISHIEGSLWSGKINNLRINRLPLGELDWELNLLPLLLGQIELDIKIQGPLGKLQSHLSLSTAGRLQATKLSGHIPAESLNPYTLPATLGGNISFNIQKLSFQNQEKLQLQGEMHWRNASISILQTVELGDVRLLAKAGGDGSILHINNEKSALGIEGSVKLSADGRYNVNLALINRDSSRNDIRTLLQMLGQADAAGKVHIQRQGRLQLRF
ncbi:MAG TPA: type II secretion system protein N [Gammaproteobacteria bacterium]|nr:type II secretion system protein N [Gammaproteobacteria bacterium]